MKISVAGIYDRGILDKERLHFRADTDIDLSFFVLLDTMRMLDATKVYAGNRSAFWFAPQAIPRGQHVVVYTRAGTPNTEKRDDGSIYNFLFRGLTYPLYAADDACAVLMETRTWVSTVLHTTPLAPLPPMATGLGSAALPGLPTYLSPLSSLADDLGIVGPGSDYARRLADILSKSKS
jgi:hypothetical protein